MPPGRTKFIHSVGVVGKVEWKDAGGHPYTGVFKGAKYGIARLSHAQYADNSSRTLPAPGMGLKFLRSGHDSANLLAMYSVAGQESWNFFENDLMNHIPALNVGSWLLGFKFRTATPNIRQVGISDWSKMGEDGEMEKDPIFPYRLRFHPTGDISFSDSFHGPVTDDLVTIPKGTKLYEIYALDKPMEIGGTEKMIGELFLTSNLITSKWGDTRLFFRHQDMAEDLRHHPEWSKNTPEFPSMNYVKQIFHIFDNIWPPKCQ